jgi:transcriptional regulator with XRE-family HTH domain
VSRGTHERRARAVIGGRVRLWRVKRHLSQEGLARAVGVNQASISNYEAGRRDVPVSTMIRIADVLQVPFEELIDQETRRVVVGEPD